MHQFGGTWTQEKLECLRKYLEAYTQALKKQSFKLVYVDAFAGTGQIEVQKQQAREAQIRLDLEGEELMEKYCEGSAKVALKLKNRFDRYIFVDRKPEHLETLRETVHEFPDLDSQVEYVTSDANEFLCRFCADTNWSNTRAVLFLDPYGLQVDWETIEAVARTKSIDTWILFPHAIGVNRLLRRDGNIPDNWGSRLDRIYGTSEWRSHFYKPEHEEFLFEMTEERTTKTATLEAIVSFYIERLETIFAGVLKKPLILQRNSGTPLYALCFACGNPKGSKIALRIAKNIVGNQ